MVHFTHQLLTLCLATILIAHPAMAQMPTFTQTLTIDSDTGTPQIDILPVYECKTWAFTARWDDNNQNHLNMQKAMTDIGLKGTFYLNQSDEKRNAGADFARQLSKDGCSVGGHTTHHHWLTQLNPAAIFREIELNRIEREDDTDKPVNSFAFPYGNFKGWREPDALKYISEAFVRSGYHHNVYQAFVKGNSYLPEGLISTVNEVVPGDREINADRFRSTIKKILDNPEQFQKIDYAISLGVHSWQSAEELVKFRALLKEYAGRDDFWYCNQTEYAAYRLQAKHTLIKSDDAHQGTYTITRPSITVTGNDVPLSLLITGNKPAKVSLDGQALEISAAGEGRWLVNLPYPVFESLPEKIDWLHFKSGEMTLTPSEEFPGLAFKWVDYKNTVSVQIQNTSDQPLTDIRVMYRMPLICLERSGYATRSQLQSGQTQSLDGLSYTMQTDPTYFDGESFFEAQVDFKRDGKPGRVYVTADMPHDAVERATVRDATWVVGPIVPDTLNWEVLVAQSVPGATRVPVNDTPLGVWYTATAKDRQLLSHKRFVQYHYDDQWSRLAKNYSRKPALLAASVDFHLPKDAALNLRADTSITHLAIDGNTVALTDYKTPTLKAGEHRIVFVGDTKSRMEFYKPSPVLLLISADDTPITLHNAK